MQNSPGSVRATVSNSTQLLLSRRHFAMSTLKFSKYGTRRSKSSSNSSRDESPTMILPSWRLNFVSRYLNNLFRLFIFKLLLISPERVFRTAWKMSAVDSFVEIFLKNWFISIPSRGQNSSADLNVRPLIKVSVVRLLLFSYLVVSCSSGLKLKPIL